MRRTRVCVSGVRQAEPGRLSRRGRVNRNMSYDKGNPAAIALQKEKLCALRSDPTTIPPLGCLFSFFLFAIPRQRVWGLHDPYVKGRGGPSAELGGAAPPHWQNSSGKKFSCRPLILLGVVFSFFEQFTNKILSAGARTWRISKSESLISRVRR